MLVDAITIAGDLGWDVSATQNPKTGNTIIYFSSCTEFMTPFSFRILLKGEDWGIFLDELEMMAFEIPDEEYPEVFDIRNEENERWVPQSKEEFKNVVRSISVRLGTLFNEYYNQMDELVENDEDILVATL